MKQDLLEELRARFPDQGEVFDQILLSLELDEQLAKITAAADECLSVAVTINDGLMENEAGDIHMTPAQETGIVVPLHFTGRSVPTETGKNFLATDTTTSVVVIVDVSAEVLQDQGEASAQNKAEEKYDAGLTNATGGVSVRTTDFH